ncbi:MAG: hypothetical protein WC269_04920 [Candidatus Gracilibacteria bacterium]|jgi:hypothetical protein
MESELNKDEAGKWLIPELNLSDEDNFNISRIIREKFEFRSEIIIRAEWFHNLPNKNVGGYWAEYMWKGELEYNGKTYKCRGYIRLGGGLLRWKVENFGPFEIISTATKHFGSYSEHYIGPACPAWAIMPKDFVNGKIRYANEIHGIDW